MMNNLLICIVLTGSVLLFGCDGTSNGSGEYPFVEHSDTPVVMDESTKMVMITTEQNNGDAVVKIDLLDGMSINGTALIQGEQKVYITQVEELITATTPALEQDELLFFGSVIIDESLGGINSEYIKPITIEQHLLSVNRHQFSAAVAGIPSVDNKGAVIADKFEAVTPEKIINEATYSITYTVDNGYPCILLDKSYYLQQCTQFLMEQGYNDLCENNGDGPEMCGQHLLDNGANYTFECEDVDNCTSSEVSTNLQTVLINSIADKISDVDGDLPNVRTLVLTITNN